LRTSKNTGRRIQRGKLLNFGAKWWEKGTFLRAEGGKERHTQIAASWTRQISEWGGGMDVNREVGRII